MILFLLFGRHKLSGLSDTVAYMALFAVKAPPQGLAIVVTRRPEGLMVKQRLLEPSEPSGRRTITESSGGKAIQVMLI
jgi:hypothetical protein